MKVVHRFLALAALTFCSCHSMADSGMSVSALRASVGSVPLTELEDYRMHSGLPAAELPLRIGIAPPVSTVHHWDQQLSPMHFGSWSDEERELIGRWAAQAQAAGLVESVEFLPSILAEVNAPNALAAVRHAAESRQLDAVLLIRVGTTLQVSASMLSFLDLALVPAFILPTAEFSATAIIESALLDTATGFPYAVGSAEAEYEKLAPSMAGSARTYTKKARLRALDSMGQRLLASVNMSAVEAAREVTEFREHQHQAGVQYWTREVPLEPAND